MLIKDLDELEQESEQEKSACKLLWARNNEQRARLQKGTKTALVGAGARALFYPTLLYNVVRNKLQPEFRWWDEIDQFLLLGAVPFCKDVQRLKEIGVRGVVTLNEPYETLVPTSMYKDHGIQHLVIPTRDYLFAPSFEDICRAVDFIHGHVECEETTYVHCKAGRGRSTTIVLCYLVEHKQMTPAGAYDYVRSKRPRVLLADSQWQAVQDYSNRRLRSQKKLMVSAGFSLPVQRSLPLYMPQKFSQGGFSQGGLTIDGREGNACYDDSIVFVTSADLEGYRSIEDVGLIGNEIRKELGMAYTVRFLPSRRLMRVARASAALARISYLWLGCQSESDVCSNSLPVACSLKPLDSCSSAAEQLSGMRIEVPICQQGIVNC